VIGIGVNASGFDKLSDKDQGGAPDTVQAQLVEIPLKRGPLMNLG
jgi:hypothetical protein